MRRLKNTINITRQLHKHYDVLLCPTLSSAAPKNNYLLNQALPASAMVNNMTNFAPFAALQNITGEPAISLPMGTSDNQLPIGMQFSASYGEDKILLELAYELEEAKAWKHIHEQAAKKKTTTRRRSGQKRQSALEAGMKAGARSIATSIGRSIGGKHGAAIARGILGSIMRR